MTGDEQVELEGRWYERLRTLLPDDSEDAIRALAMEYASLGLQPTAVVDTGSIRKQAEQTFGFSYLDEARLWIAWPVIKRKVVPVMKILLLKFWTDPAFFVGAIRAGVFALSGAVLSGQLVLPWPKATWFLAVFLPAIAVGIPAGQANQTPGTLKAIVENPETTVTPTDEKTAGAAVEKAAAAAKP